MTVTTARPRGCSPRCSLSSTPATRSSLFEPFYDAYVRDVAYRRRRAARSSRLQPARLVVRPRRARAAFTAQTQVLILNTPHNPTGKVFTRAELEQIAALCQEHECIAITDEVYDRIIFDDARHMPLATLPGMWERTLTLNSTGKTFSMTGWKIGYAIGPAHLNAALRTIHQFTSSPPRRRSRRRWRRRFEKAEARDYYAQLKREYTARRDAVRAMLEGAGLPTLQAGGSYFLLADVDAVRLSRTMSRPAVHLDRDVGVAASRPPPSTRMPAAPPMLIRFCFAKRPETLAAAAERFARSLAG